MLALPPISARAARPLRVAVLLVLLAGPLSAGPYSEMFVFGDSLSDVGNTHYWTTVHWTGWAAPDTPGTAYWQGRFSNGPVFTEWLSEGLGFGQLTTSTAGGNNFAYGGAYTSDAPALQQLYVNDLDTQIDDFTNERDPAPGAIASLLIGANNFLLGGQTNVLAPAATVGAALNDLAAAGINNFLVLNLPWLGLTPAHNGSSAEAEAWNQRSRDYNAALSSQYDAFEASHPDATLFRLDLAGLLGNLIENHNDFGLTNATNSAAPGLEAGASNYDISQIVPNPDEYVFWDGVHPTAAVHRLLGYAAVRAVLPEGDYNYDGQTTLDDLDAWRLGYADPTGLYADGNGDGRVDAADYTLWRSAFDGIPAVMGGVVPEPAAALLAGLALIARRRPRCVAGQQV
ncbi:Secreted effector protein SseJ [Posidoniimonas polymericola]|uniref:Secreted effector protein SseJ n=1 Tax=Posidoniimonas polymericola TaxID=2528002 RepID=A0A5C5YTL8_9BACT|nr:SGNH/GDSL hydrolase family protein [Posidoniimonas polymericola]TWT78308.1 Secreted effector protein SseJ [Posidoniimonas polymericola]